MKKQKFLAFSTISACLVSILSVTLLINGNESILASNSQEPCVWNHYTKLSETKDNNGCKEYWVCCAHHEISLIKPSDGTIVNKGQASVSFANTLDNNDQRVLLSYTKQARLLDDKINQLPSDEMLTFDSFEKINEINSLYENMNETTKELVTNRKSFEATTRYFNTLYPSLHDAKNDTFVNREYQTTTFDLERKQDEKVGAYTKLTNIKGHDTAWIVSQSNISLSSFKKVYFYITSSEDLSNIEFRINYDYYYKFYITVKANEWTKVVIDLNDYSLEKTSDIGIAIWKGSDFALNYSLSISSFFGEYKSPDFGKTKIFDAKTGSIKYINYEATFDMNTGYESNLGFDYIECSNIYNTTDGLWLGANSNVSVTNYSYIYFYFKCTLEKGFEVREHHNYHIDQIVNVNPNEWTKIVIEVNETNFVDGILSDIGIDNWFQHTPATAGKWYFSSFYGVKEYEKIDDYIVPIYTSSKGVDFTAYAIAPGRNKDVADNNFKVAKEAGFTKGIGLLDGRNETLQEEFTTNVQAYLNNRTSENKTALFATIDNFCSSINDKNNMLIESAYKNDIKYYALNCILYDFRTFVGECSYTVSDYELIVNRILEKSGFINNDKYYGLFYMDEPATGTSFDYQKKFYSKYQTLTNGEAFLNLLPMTNLSNKKTYKSYISSYFSNLYDYNKYISFDQYPIHKTGVLDTHLLNLEIIANQLKAKDTYDFRTFVYSSKGINSNSSHAGVDSVEDLSFQIYANLAFGSDDIAYFVYSSNADYSLVEEADKTDGLINIVDYSKSQTYYYAQQINNEVHSFEKAYRHFSWDKILTSGSCSQFTNLETKVTKYGKLTNVSGSENTLVGCFKDRSENQAFLVMNYQNSNESTYVDALTLTFNNATHVLVYKDGQKNVYPLTSGKYSFNLNVADAAFIVPLSL